MANLEDQQRRVEELKKKILEQKKGAQESARGDKAPATNKSSRTSTEPDSPASDRGYEQADDLLQSQEEANRMKALADAKHQAEMAAKDRAEKGIQTRKGEAVAGKHGKAEQHHHQPLGFSPRKTYMQVLKQAWRDGALSKDEESILATLRSELGISLADHTAMEQEIQIEIYIHAIVEGWQDGAISHEDTDRLEKLRERFNISAEEHFRLERQVRQEVLKQKG